MPMYEEPVVGAYYEDEDGRKFEVITFDENVGTVEIQYGDSTSKEIDLDDWYGMDLKQLAAEKAGEEALEDSAAGSVPEDDANLDDEDDDYLDKEDE